jgi:hypothetical protein
LYFPLAIDQSPEDFERVFPNGIVLNKMDPHGFKNLNNANYPILIPFFACFWQNITALTKVLPGMYPPENGEKGIIAHPAFKAHSSANTKSDGDFDKRKA